MSTPQTVRRWILTGAVTAITVTGTLYGANLKGEQEIKQKQKRILEATPEEMIAVLEITRNELVNRKTEFERKLANFHARKNGEEPGEGNRRSTR